MKASKIVTLILSFFIFAGIVGTAAVLSKNFTEIPEFILETSETTVKHKDDSSTNSSKAEEPITDSDINHIVYRECECYTSSTNYSSGSRRELTQSNTDPGIFYAQIPTGDSIGRSGFWGIKAGFVLDSGKIKTWTYDLDGSKAKHALNSNNPGLYTLICMSFFGNEPDLGIFSDTFSEYVLAETIESNFDFKIYVFESSAAQLKMEQITITAENDDNGYSSEQRYNRNYQDSKGTFAFSQLNFSSLDLGVAIKQTLSDGNELNYCWELSSHNVSGLSSLVILYSPNTIAISDQYDEYFGYETLIDSQTEITIGYLYFYGIFADYIEGTSLESVEYTGLYKISLTRDDFLHLSDQTGNLLLIDNDQNASRDNDVQFFLRKISTIYDGNTYDEWNGGESLDNPLAASSLEIHQDGTKLETQVTGKNDGPLGDWYIDGHITPPDVNYTLEIVIQITSIGSQSYYTSNFLNHSIFVDSLINTMWVLNKQPVIDQSKVFHINFTNQRSYNCIYFVIDNNSQYLPSNYTGIGYSNDLSTIAPYYKESKSENGQTTYFNEWGVDTYRIIKINGGPDVTNPDFCSWLELNATQVKVNDLDNTKWVLNSDIDITSVSNKNFNVTFTSNNTNYYNLSFGDTSSVYTTDISYGSNEVWNYDDEWNASDDTYRVISIIEGYNLYTVDLLLWLNNNATLVPVVDLSNTKWVFGNTIDVSTDFDYHLNFLDKSNVEFYELQVSNDAVLGGKSLLYIEDDDGEDVTNTAFNSINDWQDNSYKTIEFISGTDTTNPDLIVWLSENAQYHEHLVTEFNDIYICIEHDSYVASYSLNDGPMIQIDDAHTINGYSELQSKSYHLQNVQKLVIDGSFVESILLMNSQGVMLKQLVTIADPNGDSMIENFNITPYLIEGCYIVIYTND